MSIFSDHKVGAMDDWEFEQECIRMNRRDRQEYIDEFERLAEEDEEGEDELKH